MDVKRMLTLVFGLALVSYLAKELVWYMSPPARPHYNNFFAYDYSTVNYVQFFILFLIPSVAAFFLYRSSFKKIDSFYDECKTELTQKINHGKELFPENFTVRYS